MRKKGRVAAAAAEEEEKGRVPSPAFRSRAVFFLSIYKTNSSASSFFFDSFSKATS
jgi:hypothetical protein